MTSNQIPAPKGYEWVRVEDLHLDSKNPRLVQYNLGKAPSESELIRLLREHMDLDEVAMSIAADGYWDHEPLIVVKEGDKDLVLEGNRRLAAIRILTDAELRSRLKATDLPRISEAARRKLETVPIVRVAKRADIWRYLGFKHVNGPAKWPSYAKAQYIAFVRRTTNASLEHIADQIGDRHRSVQRLYRALMVMEQAETAGVYNREFAYRKRLAFSHLTTALDYPGFARFLKLSEKNDESPRPVAAGRMEELGEVCRWLWGDSRDDTPPVIESQNPDLRHLAAVLAHPAALSTLRGTRSLSVALEITKGEDIILAEALQVAKVSLVKAQGHVSAGFNGEKHLLDTAFAIAEMSADLHDTMLRRLAPGRAKSRASGNQRT